MVIAFFIQASAIGAQAFLIREYKGVGTALLGNLSLAIGFSLLLLRDTLPDFLTIIVANILTVTSPNLYYIAVSRFTGQRLNRAMPSALVSITAMILIYFTYIQNDVNIRIIAISLISAISTFFVINRFWNARHAPYRFGAILAVIPFAIYGMFLLARAIATIFAPPNAIFANTPIEIATYLLLFLISFLWTIGFILMVSQRLQADLTELATVDTLTRIPNRHAAQIFFGKELSRKERHGDEFSVMLIDLDNFKQVNDKYGHALGDLALIRVANIFQAAIRKQDSVSRWGGEEFLVILPNTTIPNAQILAERLRQDISDTEINDNNSSVKITISVGIAHSVEENSMDEILKRADDALYVAKATKNAVVAAN